MFARFCGPQSIKHFAAQTRQLQSLKQLRKSLSLSEVFYMIAAPLVRLYSFLKASDFLVLDYLSVVPKATYPALNHYFTSLHDGEDRILGTLEEISSVEILVEGNI